MKHAGSILHSGQGAEILRTAKIASPQDDKVTGATMKKGGSQAALEIRKAT